jgi:hypothetical protein
MNSGRLKYLIYPGFVICLVACFSICCYKNNNDGIISIDNNKISLGFDRRTGEILYFNDLINNYNFLDTIKHHDSPWQLDLIKSSGKETIDIFNAEKFSFSRPDSLSLIFIWKKFEGGNENLVVTASVSMDGSDPVSYWKISVEGINGFLVSQVVFPRIAGINESGEEYLAVPEWMGQVLRDPRGHLAAMHSKVKKYEWGYPGPLSMQCLALYNPDKYGFYASCNDSLAYRKNFSFSIDNAYNLVYQMTNFPALDSTLVSYSPPYAAIIGSFKGDWITAAEIYREWGTKQKWCTESRFKKRLTPPWLENTALWVWNRGRSDNVLRPATEMSHRLGLPVSVFWHWWHGCSYDDGFPEYMPPREGGKSFINAMAAAQGKGVRAIVYMNQALWGTTTESWKHENASQFSARDASGKTLSHVFNIFTGKPAAYMCMGTRFWKDKYSSLCDSAVNHYRANGVYMDMACLNSMCFDRTHGHPVGGGNYWIEHFGKMTKLIRSKITRQDQLVLAGEGCGEVWLPHLDLFLTLAVSKERYAGVGDWETIPFFQAVYHQFGITYGSYSSLLVPPYDDLWPKKFAPEKPLKLLDRDFKKQFLMEQARSFVWGLQPTISNYQIFLPAERKEEIKYLTDLGQTRNKGLPYLLHGKFLRSPDIEFPDEEFDISRLSIYAGKMGESVTRFRSRYPLIYSGTWQSENKIGIALASISEHPFNVNFNFDSKDYDLPASGKIYIIDVEGKKFINSYSENKISVNYTLKPRGICIIEITN